MNEFMPREKAIEHGISSLNNEELLALIIKSACKGKTVFDLAKDILELSNGFDNLLCLNYEELVSIKGIKTAKALEFMAILEISKRLSKIEKIAEPDLQSPSKIVDWLRFNLGYSSQEEFFVVYLNRSNSIIRSEVMYKGNKHSANVGIDEIIRKAILLKSSYIVVAHNHPSDNVEPSDADIHLTVNLAKACEMMGIRLLDHIIIGKTDYFSFKNHDMLK